MGFFNKKEDVLDVQLTQHGKRLLSIGRFKPTYYAFFDDDIIYDSSYAGFTDEEQNEIQDRIELTPRTKAQYVFSSRQNAYEELLEQISPLGELPRINPPSGDNDYSLVNVLGNSSIGKSETPAWNINFLRGKFNSAKIPIAGANEKQTNIPQIDMVDVEYRTEVKKFNNYDDINLSASRIYSDGSYVSVEDDYLLIDVKELNTDLENDNFDIEVFKVQEDETLKRLYFIKKPIFIKDDILLDEPEGLTPQIDLGPNYVEYWFNMYFDGNIDKDIICENRPENDTTGGVFVQEALKCDDKEPDVAITRRGAILEEEDIC